MILCLDLETTGLDEQRCGIIEIGACWLHTGEVFFRKCRPLAIAEIEPEALKVNGRTVEQISDESLLREELAIIEFLGWVKGDYGVINHVQIAAWNAHFDHRHLCAAMDRAGVEHRQRPFLHRLLDVHSILAADELRKFMPTDPARQPAILANCGGEIPNSDTASEMLRLHPEPKPHGAVAGAKQVRAMLRRLLGDPGALP